MPQEDSLKLPGFRCRCFMGQAGTGIVHQLFGPCEPPGPFQQLCQPELKARMFQPVTGPDISSIEYVAKLLDRAAKRSLGECVLTDQLVDDAQLVMDAGDLALQQWQARVAGDERFGFGRQPLEKIAANGVHLRDNGELFAVDELEFGVEFVLRGLKAGLRLAPLKTAVDRERRQPGHDEQPNDQGQRRYLALAPRPAGYPLHRTRAPGMNGLVGDEAVQVVGQGRGVRVTVVWLSGQTLEADRLQVARGHSDQVAGDRFASDPLQDFDQACAVVGRLATQEFKQDCPEGVNIGRRAHGVAAATGLFGSHVIRRAKNGPRLRVGCLSSVEPPGQSEVGNLRAKTGDRILLHNTGWKGRGACLRA